LNFADMDHSPAKLKVAVFDRTVCIQVSGRADFTCTVDLQKLINQLWERGYTHFIFELRDCRMMDSTFMGVLTDISMQLTKLANGSELAHPIELLNANPRISETLENLGVAGLFEMCGSDTPLSDKFEPLSEAAPASPVELARTCLKAHQTLISISAENAQRCKDVAQFMAEDLHRLEIGQSR
jgi:anti-anti-sigma regulatory factor